MLAIQSLRLPRSSEAWFGIAVPVQQALGSTDFDADPSITLLVNNAGCASVAPLLDADIQNMEDMIALDVTAPLAYESGMRPPLCF